MMKRALAAALAATAWWMIRPVGAEPAAYAAPAPGASLPAPSAAQPLSLGLRDALARARRAGPVAEVGRLRVEEARAHRVDAEIFPRKNPELDFALGPRVVGEDLDSVFFGVGLQQSLDMGGGRASRLRRVDADVAMATAGVERLAQTSLRDTATSFLRALWAEGRAGLAGELEATARAGFEASKKRLEAGDATALEVNVAKAGAARAAAARKAFLASREAALGELRIRLGLAPEAPLTLRGTLAESLAKAPEELRQAALTTPELRVLAAELEAAAADEDLADALAWPEITLGVRYEHEDRVGHTVLGTLAFTLPFFERAQGLAAEARARASRASREIAAEKARTAGGLRTALIVLERRADAAQAFDEQGGVEALRANLELATKGYAAGETSLGELLLMRRELTETEADRLDRLLEVRLTEVEVLAAAGAL